jgi:2-C-methyl-D-erythritol 4-phosphate cytidylyltransferase
MQYWVVLPAAGTGRRFGSELPKQYAPLAGRTVIEWSLQPFLQDLRCCGIVVALAADDHRFATLAGLAGHSDRLYTTVGGEQRCHSVLQGLAALPAAAEDWVLVHDAARPCLTRAELDTLLTGLQLHPVGGLLGLPLADTLKQADADGQVLATVPRAHLWRAQTPQMFRYGLLQTALQQALARGEQPTDEAQAIEAMGWQPQLLAGRASNIKITQADDLLLAQWLLAQTAESA